MEVENVVRALRKYRDNYFDPPVVTPLQNDDLDIYGSGGHPSDLRSLPFSQGFVEIGRNKMYTCISSLRERETILLLVKNYFWHIEKNRRRWTKIVQYIVYWVYYQWLSSFFGRWFIVSDNYIDFFSQRSLMIGSAVRFLLTRISVNHSLRTFEIFAISSNLTKI